MEMINGVILVTLLSEHQLLVCYYFFFIYIKISKDFLYLFIYFIVPGQSPKTDIGSFEVFENTLSRDIYLYWQYIPPYLENGNDFRYRIISVEENGRRVHLTPNETTRTYAKFRGLSHHSSYRFEIVASNEVGIFERPATIFVPGKSSCEF